MLSPGAWMRNALYPKRCIFCGIYLERDDSFLCCSACEKKLVAIRYSQTIDEYLCISAAIYADTMRRAIVRFKFHQKPQYAYTFARLMQRALYNQTDFDRITWVPTSAFRRLKRGYDQSALLAKELGKLMGIPVVRGLRKVKPSKKQSELSARDRMENARGKYRAYPGRVSDMRILVVDDVYTTGSTMNECIKTLKAAGAASCTGVTIAKTEFVPKTDAYFR